MGRTYDRLDDALVGWLGRQHVFFVASAPSGATGHVNLSPKGYDSFRVLDERTVAYLDLTGSGVETIAHVTENGRLTFMFCAFEGPPRIVRLFGRGTVLLPGTAAFDEHRAVFPDLAGGRAVIVCHLDRIQSSCGYAVPFMDYQGERTRLVEWAEHQGPDGLDAYHAEKNEHSIDGLPGLRAPGS
jgi:Pyridoxamine 5'-phosphate oxidase